MRRIISKEADVYIREHFETESYQSLAEKFGVTERQMRGHINNMGWTKRRTVDAHYFDEIDTPEKAYWLGFIYADGYICGSLEHGDARGTELGMELQTQDRYILDLLSRDLGGECSIVHYEKDKRMDNYSFHTSTDAIRVYSKPLCRGLVQNGVVKQKTLSAEHPRPTKYLSDFVRGYLDGDGCIYISPRNYCVVSFTCANKEFLQWVSGVVTTELGIDGSLYTEKDRKHRLMYYRENDARELLDWVYHGCGDHKLLRKYNIYKSFYGLAA